MERIVQMETVIWIIMEIINEMQRNNGQWNAKWTNIGKSQIHNQKWNANGKIHVHNEDEI